MARQTLTKAQLALIAEEFKTLAEPARLGILGVLRAGEMTVGELVEATGLGQANLSKHLQLLHAHGWVKRRKEGLFVHYSLAGDEAFRLCDIVCGRLEDRTEARRRTLAR